MHSTSNGAGPERPMTAPTTCQRHQVMGFTIDVYQPMRNVVLIATMQALIDLQRDRLQRLTERLEAAPLPDTTDW